MWRTDLNVGGAQRHYNSEHSHYLYFLLYAYGIDGGK